MERSEKTFLFLILLFAFFVRFYRVFIPDVIANDGVFYIQSAKLIAKGNFTELRETGFFNLYPVFIYLFYKVIGVWEISGRLVSVVFGTLSIIPFYLLAKKLINVKVGLVSAFFYAISPHVVDYSSDVLREGFFWFLFLFSLYFGVAGILSERLRLVLLSSVFLLLSLLTRIEGTIALAIILSWAVYLFAKDKINRQSFLRFLCNYCLAFFSLALFVLIFFRLYTSEWELGPLGYKIKNMYLDGMRYQTSIEKELTSISGLSPLAYSFIDVALRHRYIIYASEIAYKAAKSLGIVFLVFIVIGILRNHTPFPHGRYFFYFWIVFSGLASYAYMCFNQYFSTRHGLLLAIPLLVWASKGFFELVFILEERLTLEMKGRNFSKALPTLLIVLILAFSLPLSVGASRSNKIELKQAGGCLKENGLKNKKIATFPNLSRVIFYADAHPVYLNSAKDPLAIKEYMQKEGISFLLLDFESKKMIEDKRTLRQTGFEEVSLSCFETLKGYSFFLFRLNGVLKGG